MNQQTIDITYGDMFWAVNFDQAIYFFYMYDVPVDADLAVTGALSTKSMHVYLATL